MSNYFLDSSALIKRYLSEKGSKYVMKLTASSRQQTVLVAEITQVEVAAALAARYRAPKGISLTERDGAVNLSARHFRYEYQLVGLSQTIL